MVHTFENSVVITWPDSLLFTVNVLKAVPYDTGGEPLSLAQIPC